MGRPFLRDETVEPSSRRKVFEYFGTFRRTFVTMYEISLSNWTKSMRVLMNEVDEWWGLFYVLYQCCCCFAVIRVIQAVFIAETNRVVAADDEIAVARKLNDREKLLLSMQEFFAAVDSSGDGCITKDELAEIGKDDVLKSWLAVLEVKANDLDELFALLDDGDGKVHFEEFVKCLSNLRGPAQSFDVNRLLVYSRRQEEQLGLLLASRPRPSLRSISVTNYVHAV